MFIRFLSRIFTPRNLCAEWRRDPLSHPDIAAMDERALGDLPFDPRHVAAD